MNVTKCTSAMEATDVACEQELCPYWAGDGGCSCASIERPVDTDWIDEANAESLRQIKRLRAEAGIDD